MPSDQSRHATAAEQLTRLLEIMYQLRQPEGCPWDRKQTSRTLAPYLIEEAHEVIEAIDHDDPEWLCEELGDLLLQIVFHAQIHSEANHFDMSNVVEGIANKMIRRHPHVFDGLICTDEAELHANWEKIKKAEKAKQKNRNRSSTLPYHLPALHKAQKTLASLNSSVQHPLLSAHDFPEELNKACEHLAVLDREKLSTIIPRLLLWTANLAELNGLDSEGDLRKILIEFEQTMQPG